MGGAAKPNEGRREHGADTRARAQALDAAVRDLATASTRLSGAAGGADEIDRMLGGIEDVWLDVAGRSIHLDVHPSADAKATVVFHPGSGAHARLYFVLGGLLARRGYRFVGIDRPGHGLSEGDRGDCTVEEAIDVTAAVIDDVRPRWHQPVALMGSSMGGLLTMFSVLVGLTPDAAVAHNFVYPGKLVSLRLRSRWISRYRTAPYPIVELERRFERLSDDPAINAYVRERHDPEMAWELTARSVASMFGFRVPTPAAAPPCLVLNGDRDRAVPAFASKLFTRWSRLPDAEVRVVPDAGHHIFFDELDRSVPLVVDWLDSRLTSTA
jgi:alpha-beta hydrolase superfamily lysophospholipase